MLPFNLPLVAAATACNLNWFYPAFMIALGTHYLPFIFLYGMPDPGQPTGTTLRMHHGGAEGDGRLA